MSEPLRAYDRLRQANFSDDQARAILDAFGGDLVTRDYLDAKLAALENKLIVWGIGLTGAIIAISSAINAVIARTVHA